MHKGYTQYMLIWDNPELPELSKLEGFDLWKKAGIRFLYTLHDNNILPYNKIHRMVPAAQQIIFFSNYYTLYSTKCLPTSSNIIPLWL